MSDTKQTDALESMEALLRDLDARVKANPDYRAWTALKKAIAEVRGAPAIQESIEAAEHRAERLRVKLKRHPVTQAIAAAKAITAKGHPVVIGELVELTRAQGATVGGDDPAVNLGSTLSRDKKFRSVRWRGNRAWWLAGHPIPSGATSLGDAQETETAESVQGTSAAPSVNH